jgi:endogenous inhibitor of DNA gyrase (YacG/DUF329 family)
MDRMGEARLCVLCRVRPTDERWKPFCSERCRNEDLARWADGRYSVASDAEPADSASLDSDASNDPDPD